MGKKHLLILAILGTVSLTMSAALTPQTNTLDCQQGGLIDSGEDEFGTFFVYIPNARHPDTRILALIHGTPAANKTAVETAQYYLENWCNFAHENNFALIAPAFDQENFSSRKGDIEGAHTGYRGLFGREISADAWVLKLVRRYQQEWGIENDTFYLYGHSAGGQFVGRFLVMHPGEVAGAVITAAATYPQPDPSLAWPFGMGTLHTEIQWDQNTTQKVAVTPDEQKWLAATRVPLTVIVGLNDTAQQPQRPGQQGTNRITIGRNWVQAMSAFAEQRGRECLFEFETIPGKGHSMSGLLPYSQAAMIQKQLMLSRKVFNQEMRMDLSLKLDTRAVCTGEEEYLLQGEQPGSCGEIPAPAAPAHVAANLGSVETIISPPDTTSHVECSAVERASLGIPKGLIRYATGIEDVENPIADLEHALNIY